MEKEKKNWLGRKDLGSLTQQSGEKIYHHLRAVMLRELNRLFLA